MIGRASRMHRCVSCIVGNQRVRLSSCRLGVISNVNQRQFSNKTMYNSQIYCVDHLSHVQNGTVAKYLAYESLILTRNLLTSQTTIRNYSRVINTAKRTHLSSAVAASEKGWQENDRILKKKQSIEEIFPMPRYSLNHMYMAVAEYYNDNTYKLNAYFTPIKKSKKAATSWECGYIVKWPKEMMFKAAASTKQEAALKVSIELLEYLYQNGNITKQNLPVLPEQISEIQHLKNKPQVLELSEKTLNYMESISRTYHEELLPHLKERLGDTSQEGEEIAKSKGGDEWDASWPVFEDARFAPFKGLEFYAAKEEKMLPISKYKEDIQKAIRHNRVVIIKGEPGCGKSTRVPQYILEDWARCHADAKSGAESADCRIVITQPRRIAAISLAERVAGERCERLGHTVGFQVRLQSNFNRRHGRVLFCTTGILLRRLQDDPALTSLTHVVLDEAHERDVNTDLLLNLLKRALHLNPNLRLMVMSATIKAEAFQEYLDDACAVHVPGFTYPVVAQHLDESCKMPKTLAMTKEASPFVVHDELANFIVDLHREKGEGAILVFLPGWEDITQVRRLLQEHRTCRDMKILCVHSRVPVAEQKLIFHRFPPGTRKVVLATNIAETSVTIDDVVYVVDTGIHKEVHFDAQKGVNVMDNHWVSKANVAQRRGRAGRVQPGEAFLLYPMERYKMMDDYATPEIQRTSLTKIVLDAKVLSNNTMSAGEFLGELITPPKATAIQHAVDELRELSLIDGDERVTALGRALSKFQLEPKLAKVLINAVVFKCVTPLVDIVTYYAAESEVFANTLTNKDDVRAFRARLSPSSDHLAAMHLFEMWLEMVDAGDEDGVRSFCNKHGILDYKMRTLQKLRDIHFGYLNKGFHDVLPLSDDHSDSDELIKAVLLSGVGTVLQQRDFDVVKGRLKKKNVFLTSRNHKATISMESVNCRKLKNSDNFLLYINETRSNIRRITVIRETSVISPITLLLFKNNALVMQSIKMDQDSSNVAQFEEPVRLRLDGTQFAFVMEKRQAELLCECKEALTAAHEYYIYQLTQGGEHDSRVNQVWDQIVGDLEQCLQMDEKR